MKIGIIAEGPSDSTIIQALLKSLKKIDGSDIQWIRPIDSKDETDLNNIKTFSNWTIVFEECRTTTTFENFFDIFDDERYLIIQIDTAECEETGYEVARPERSRQTDWAAYSTELRSRTIAKLQSLIPEKYHDRILYAICVEELEAWLIPIWPGVREDSAKHTKAKEKLKYIISCLDRNSKYIDTAKKDLNYEAIGKELKIRVLKECRSKNKSLDLFCESIEEKIPNSDE